MHAVRACYQETHGARALSVLRSAPRASGGHLGFPSVQPAREQAVLEQTAILDQDARHRHTHRQVFPTTNSAIKQAWQRAKKRAQERYKADGGKDPDFLVDFRFHDNRHEAASRWAREFDVKQLQMLTGHKDLRSLMRYVNPNEDEDDVALLAAKMAESHKAKSDNEKDERF